jgi:copper(I)-binding protein
MVRSAMRISSLLVLALAVCFALVTTPSAVRAHDGGHLRVAHLAPAAPAVDIYLNGEAAITGLNFRQTSAYLSLPDSAQMALEIAVVPAGGALADAVYTTALSLPMGGGYFTAVAFGSLEDGTFEIMLLPEDGVPPATGAASGGALVISGAFARPTASGTTQGMGHGGHGGMSGTVSAAYMTIRNEGAMPDRLVSATADAARTVEIHETVIENDVARMQMLPEGIAIPAGEAVELRPGGLHLMLIGLHADLVPGMAVTLTLTFESGEVITVRAPVRMP